MWTGEYKKVLKPRGVRTIAVPTAAAGGQPPFTPTCHSGDFSSSTHRRVGHLRAPDHDADLCLTSGRREYPKRWGKTSSERGPSLRSGLPRMSVLGPFLQHLIHHPPRHFVGLEAQGASRTPLLANPVDAWTSMAMTNSTSTQWTT